ncbi:MAG: hypothetical protein AAF628_28755 [Planctomycetota bacterium]
MIHQLALLSGLAAAWTATILVPTEPTVSPPTQPPAGTTDDYWYRGLAEVSTYDVERRRYGEARSGYAVLIFVTEDFLTEAQTKAEGRVPSGDRAVNVLKLNRIERFETGIYDYSLMTSVFTPADGSPTLKTSTSIQDWCGHVWEQLNRRGESFRVTGHSYFQAEGDGGVQLPAHLLEDEVWTRLRLAPDRLPQGELQVIPSSVRARLSHRPLTAVSARGTLRDGTKPDERIYELAFDRGRTLQISFAAAAPHRIRGWVETERGQLVTRGTRRAITMTDYWAHNGNRDRGLRQPLGLPVVR